MSRKHSGIAAVCVQLHGESLPLDLCKHLGKIRVKGGLPTGHHHALDLALRASRNRRTVSTGISAGAMPGSTSSGLWQ